MTKPKTTPKAKTIDRKRISEALLADRLGLNEEWIERWEDRGKIREESLPDGLPAFIHKNFKKGEIEDIETEVERLVAAGCRQQVVYFCLAQLSPEAKWFRAGGERTPLFRSGGKDAVVDADYFKPDEHELAAREDLQTSEPMTSAT